MKELSKELFIMIGKFILLTLVCELVGFLFLCLVFVILSLFGITLV